MFKSETLSPVVQNCHDLEQYVKFLKLIDKAKSDGQAPPLARAIRGAVRHNILKDYLERKGGETFGDSPKKVAMCTNLPLETVLELA